jgi:hypothetical protein
MTTQLMISRDFHGATIRQRSSDGYLNATDSARRLVNCLPITSALKPLKNILRHIV